jgi:hypothetical protein
MGAVSLIRIAWAGEMRISQSLAACAVLLLEPLTSLLADGPKPSDKPDPPKADRSENGPKTLGGQIFWADELLQTRVSEFLKHGYFISEAKRQPIKP